jgi:hypothetical protein
LEKDPSKAREAAREVSKIYQGLPNYRNNWIRMGLSEEDIDSLNDKFIDTTFAWGTETAIQERISAHFDAGADHVCIQPVNASDQMSGLDWDCLEALAS